MPTMIQGVTLYTVNEVADVLKITPQTVRVYLKQGKLEGQRIGRPVLIAQESLDAFLMRRGDR